MAGRFVCETFSGNNSDDVQALAFLLAGVRSAAVASAQVRAASRLELVIEKVAKIISEFPDGDDWSKVNAETRARYERLAAEAVVATHAYMLGLTDEECA